MSESALPTTGFHSDPHLNGHLRAAQSLVEDEELQLLYRRYSRPRLAELLGAIGLDVVYRRGHGDRLWYGPSGGEIEVLDLLSGYGAALLGHNHPELVAIAEASLRSGVAANAQASCRGWSALLCAELARRLEVATRKEYVVHLLNTGTEAAEGAVRHAEAARLQLLERACAEAASSARAWEEEVEQGAASAAAPEAASLPQDFPELRQAADARAMIAAIREFNRAAAARPPKFLALEQAYHGSGTSAGKLSWGARYRAGLALTGIDAGFVAADRPEDLERIARAAEISVWTRPASSIRAQLSRDSPSCCARPAGAPSAW